MAVRNKDRLRVELRDTLRMGFCRPSLATVIFDALYKKEKGE